MNWEFTTHVPLLYEACRMTTGLVVEIGVGICSTPLLHALTFGQEPPRRLLSLDDNATWLSMMRNHCVQQDPVMHEFVHVADWEKNLAPIVEMKPDVVFVDNGLIDFKKGEGSLRVETILRFADSAKIIVAHDWSNILSIHEKEISPKFKHVVIDNHAFPTSVWLSNSLKPEFGFQRLSL